MVGYSAAGQKMKRQLLALQKPPELLRRYNRFEKFAKSRLLTPEETPKLKPKRLPRKKRKPPKKPPRAQPSQRQKLKQRKNS